MFDEKEKSTGIEINQAAFKSAFQRFVLGVLDGFFHTFEKEIDFDSVFAVIPESFHADLFRQSCERIASATADGFVNAVELFPKYLSGMPEMAIR